MSANTLTEFLNENLHRNYPLLDGASGADSNAEFNIPTELFADLRIVTPTGYKAYGSFFVSGLVVRRYTLDVEISYKPDAGVITVLGYFRDIKADADAFTEYEMVTSKQTLGSMLPLEDSYGVMVAGVGIPTTILPGSYRFLYGDGALVPTVSTEQVTQFRSLRVGSSVITGDVVLEEGANITLELSNDSNTGVTTIKINAQEPSVSGIVLTDDASLLAALTDLYGEPITSINQIPPENGNFDLTTADCLAVSQAGLAGLVFTNPCGVPCCDKDSYLTPVYDSVNQLNSRHVRLEDFLADVRTQLGILIPRLKDLENSVGAGGF